MSDSFQQLASSPLRSLMVTPANQMPESITLINKNQPLRMDKDKKKNDISAKSDRLKRLNYVQQLLQHHMTINDARKINKKIFILYTSGCVGANQKLQIYKQFLRQKMLNNSYLCDYKLTLQNHPDYTTLISPILQNGFRVQYSIQCMPSIMASINSTITQVVSIAQKIQENYQYYDSFIIITGFDLMSYIATSLSFMLENLSKCVIFTGGHFPISYVRNDFINNIIQSFSIISLSKNLNDVLIVCKNKGYRANRSVKVKQSQMDTIKSPNMHSLVSIDIKISNITKETILGFKYHLFLPIPTEPFSVFTYLSQKVHVLKFHIFMNKQTLKYDLQNPHIVGYVIQSYTAANLPQDQQILEIFKQASQKYGKIFINISQNIYKDKRSIMKEYLQKFYIHYGGDMTVEAALAKLSYLIAKGYSKEQITERISMNLRGQITETKSQNQFQIQAQGFMQAVEVVLQNYYPTSSQKNFTSILQDQIGKYISSKNSKNQLKCAFKNCKNHAKSDKLADIINRNLLFHQAVIHENIPLVTYFLQLPISKDKLDQNQNSAFFYALKSFNKSIIQLLYKKNCHVICAIDDLLDLFIGQIKKDNTSFFQLLYHIQFKTSLCEIVNNQKRNIGHIAALLGAEKCLEMFLSKFKFQFNQKDNYGFNIEDYITLFKKKIQSRSSVNSFI